MAISNSCTQPHVITDEMMQKQLQMLHIQPLLDVGYVFKWVITRPGRRIVDHDHLQRLLQSSEIVVKKMFRWLHLKKKLEIVVNDG